MIYTISLHLISNRYSLLINIINEKRIFILIIFVIFVGKNYIYSNITSSFHFGNLLFLTKFVKIIIIIIDLLVKLKLNFLNNLKIYILNN